MSVVKTRLVHEGFRSFLETETGTPFGSGKAPDGHGDKYGVLYSVTTAARGQGGFADPEGTRVVRFQVITAGQSDEQAHWVMDEVYEAVFGTDATGWANPITVTDHVVWDRAIVTDIGSGNSGPTFQRLMMVDLSTSRVA